jgi:MFS family permease
MFAVAWGGNEFTPLLGLYRRVLGLDELAVTALLSAYVLGIVPSLFLAGPLLRRFGAKRTVYPVPALSLLGSVLIIAGTWTTPLLFAGRVIIGLALGIGMVAGGVWLTELSASDRDATARPGRGARRAAMSLTAGFGLGAGLVGVAAQWSPLPTILPYVPHIVIAGVAQLMLGRIANAPARAPRLIPPAVPSRQARATYLRVLPVAPWIFGSLGLAYAILPQIVMGKVGTLITAYSALLCLTSLGTGFLTQRLLGRFTNPASFPAAVSGFGLFAASTIAAGLLMESLSPWVVLGLAVVLGCSYGLMIAGCLQDVERTAPPALLARMISTVYALAYIGFGLPTLVAWVNSTTGTPHAVILLWTITMAAVAVLIGRLLARRRMASPTLRGHVVQ